MKRLILAAIALSTSAAASAPAPIVGRWLTPERDAMVEIGACGAQLCGRIARALKVDPAKPKTDVNNPDPALRGRSLIGLAILSGFTAGQGQWNGRIYDPRNGKSYRSILIRDGATLKVKGCLGPFCRTQVWTRTN